MQLAQIKEELNNTSSNNAYPRFSSRTYYLAANSFYITPPKPQETYLNSCQYASDPADATGDPVNRSDPSGMCWYVNIFCDVGSVFSGGSGVSNGCEPLSYFWDMVTSADGLWSGVTKSDAECWLQDVNWQKPAADDAAKSFNWNKSVTLGILHKDAVLFRYGGFPYPVGAWFTPLIMHSPTQAKSQLGLQPENPGTWVYAVEATNDTLALAGWEGHSGDGKGYQYVVGTYETEMRPIKETSTCLTSVMNAQMIAEGYHPGGFGGLIG